MSFETDGVSDESMENAKHENVTVEMDAVKKALLDLDNETINFVGGLIQNMPIALKAGNETIFLLFFASALYKSSAPQAPSKFLDWGGQSITDHSIWLLLSHFYCGALIVSFSVQGDRKSEERRIPRNTR